MQNRLAKRIVFESNLKTSWLAIIIPCSNSKFKKINSTFFSNGEIVFLTKRELVSRRET